MLLLLQRFERLADAKKLLTLVLEQMGLFQKQLALGRQDGALNEAQGADDFALELFQFRLNVRLSNLKRKKEKIQRNAARQFFGCRSMTHDICVDFFSLKITKIDWP